MLTLSRKSRHVKFLLLYPVQVFTATIQLLFICYLCSILCIHSLYYRSAAGSQGSVDSWGDGGGTLAGSRAR